MFNILETLCIGYLRYLKEEVGRKQVLAPKMLGFITLLFEIQSMKCSDVCSVCAAMYHQLVSLETANSSQRHYVCGKCSSVYCEVFYKWGHLDETNLRQIMDQNDCDLCALRSYQCRILKKSETQQCQLCILLEKK